MKSSRWWICGCMALVGLVGSPVVQAQKTVVPNRGMLSRYQNLQKQSAKHAEQMQKAFQEWSVKARAEAEKKAAEHRAEVARRKNKLDEDRAAKSAKIKQHNEAAAANAKSHEKPKTPATKPPATNKPTDKVGEKKPTDTTDKVDAPQPGDPARPTAEKPKVPEKSPKVKPGAKATPPTKK